MSIPVAMEEEQTSAIIQRSRFVIYGGWKKFAKSMESSKLRILCIEKNL